MYIWILTCDVQVLLHSISIYKLYYKSSKDKHSKKNTCDGKGPQGQPTFHKVVMKGA
jgi:hypothetical protein